MMNYQKRCEDCACLVVKNGCWCCDECFGQKCSEIDECPEGIETQEIETIEEKAKENKVKLGAKAEKPKSERKSKVTKVSDEKKELFGHIVHTLKEIYSENAEISKENKLIIVRIDEKVFKIDLIEQRPPKK